MRITILQGAFLPVPPLRGGAIEKAWQALGEAFVRAGHQVTHISRRCDGLPKEEKINGVHHLRIKGGDACSNPLLLKSREIFYVWQARKILPPADILVTHAFWAPILFPQEKFGKIYVHVGRYPKGQMGLYKKATRLQVPSRAVEKAVSKELSVQDDRVLTIPYPLPFADKDIIAVGDRPKCVLYTGRIHPEKGVLELVRAWLRLPEAMQKEWNLRLVGPWRAEQGGGGKDFLRKVLAEGNESVEIIDPIFEEKELIAEYKKARVFVYPSKAWAGETFGLAVLEAMSCGCVPIVSSLECFADFMNSGINGIRVKGEPGHLEDSLLNELQNLLNNPNLEPFSKQAILTAQEYEVDRVAAQFLADFNKLMAK
ncbi:MAG: glycosyltransferase family 4 protein [Opitutae bacterium]